MGAINGKCRNPLLALLYLSYTYIYDTHIILNVGRCMLLYSYSSAKDEEKKPAAQNPAVVGYV